MARITTVLTALFLVLGISSLTFAAPVPAPPDQVLGSCGGDHGPHDGDHGDEDGDGSDDADDGGEDGAG